ncbi:MULTISPECIES: hypothetical protein [Anaerotruncus]|jgi:hypothetical protein|uniref:DUF4309 domain-containing protein n=1 Tax=Anaerotruncus colihominis TaxID=169435 RepID=A0A845SYE4_9FIRM|nr:MULTISPECIES: hypothetical protein [Anaerotruncus]MCI8493111.1 hypothetical protein [Anaerotruncus sp.]MCR2024158.1 hypothetical protein [Anaerotruncus colihominis]NDO39292.1 hypothetical protein [Anaerotruncus colihominis]
MRKSFLLLFCSIAMLLAFSGCRGTVAAGFSESDLALTVAGKEYHTRDNIETVMEVLGDGYQYAEGRSCDYDGLDKTYTYEAATFYTNPLTEGDLLAEIYSESPETSTSKGISPGATKADVLAAYGDPTEQDEYILIYRASEEIGSPSLCFELEGDTVTAVFLTVDPV